MKKRVLVTGGAGFLSSHLCARLPKQECEVLCVDSFFTGMRRNIEPLLGEPAYFDALLANSHDANKLVWKFSH